MFLHLANPIHSENNIHKIIFHPSFYNYRYNYNYFYFINLQNPYLLSRDPIITPSRIGVDRLDLSSKMDPVRRRMSLIFLHTRYGFAEGTFRGHGRTECEPPRKIHSPTGNPLTTRMLNPRQTFALSVWRSDS